ncbi:multisubunit sodium/proton antiporter, MrpA subunit [Kushneria avicenniae]|uniref:Multisubunit sodium/proton antiporter, MrpA subunit n=1 Tax=Kushneria avicenniae TaxID=402385 RepID=A0A1I1KPF5_9GAMM|nr:putative monovalent cation/H+ antiporter subunit A [Kushneria avicenniae]SFC60023.1 multisubunit sodium/proton antiporter, MrpA subunit [Kushneria avicenniae]
MQIAVLTGFVLAILVPFLSRWCGSRTGMVLALYPAAVALWLVSLAPAVLQSGGIYFEQAWAPSLGLSLSFWLDGLSLLFGLLISGIGTLIILYASGYLHGHPQIARFYVLILSFMSSMLGVVMADGLMTLFVFWELTSITSYMLIGFNHEDAAARKSALQGLLVTFTGGLALLSGLILLNVVGGSWSLQTLLDDGEALREHALYLPMLLCLLGGAFTKSAQFPFHFWLPNAMAAPTPVSAYLHSATMVKAGIYLMARLQPGLGGTEVWMTLLCIVGAITMVVGAFLAIRFTGIKKVLAYSTVMALGTLTMLLGIGGEAAMIAFVSFLTAHSLYKGALFMVAGALDHETGTKDIDEMGGLRRAMPVTALCAFVAALSLGGVIPLFGFVAKELMFEAVLDAPRFTGFLIGMSLLASVLVVAAAGIVALRPFFGALKTTPKTPHEAPLSMLAGPCVLAGLSLLLGFMPWLAGDGLLSAAASAVAGSEVVTDLYLWHGINTALMMSMFSLCIGLLVCWRWPDVRGVIHRFSPVLDRGPEAGYWKLMDLLVRVSEWQTRLLQSGYMRNYLILTLLSFVGLTGYTLLARHGPVLEFELDVRLQEVVVALVTAASAVVACMMRSRLAAVAAAGVMGFGIALIFLLFSAPDLAITQLLIETLTVILLILVLFRMPQFSSLSTPMERVRDMLVAVGTGVLMTLLILTILGQGHLFTSISEYMIDNSEPLGHGHNIVNVILVDFRALDTLGEIFVLSLAAIGVLAMLRLQAKEKKAP